MYIHMYIHISCIYIYWRDEYLVIFISQSLIQFIAQGVGLDNSELERLF